MKPRLENASVIAARESIDGMVLELTPPDIDIWFQAHPFPSPTKFAIDFDIDPSALKAAAADNPLVRLAMYRIIAQAESKLYTHVYGPKAVIQRVELFLPIETVSDNDFSDMFESTAG